MYRLRSKFPNHILSRGTKRLFTTEPASPLDFQVTRHEPELIAPAKPTPLETKPLSDIDGQDGLRFQIPVIQIYRKDPSKKGKEPVKVIREALAKTLVPYYPFAGRVREGTGRKLTVDCTGEGVLFTEADADVRLEEFGDAIHPPIPGFDELLYDVPGSTGILNSPLMLIQVTRLMCGGFIFGLRLNHTVSDAPGVVQFMAAMAEIVRGATTPSVQPVWQRERLTARDPPRVTCKHPEFTDIADPYAPFIPIDNVVCRNFFFSPTKVSTLRRLVSPRLGTCSTFDVVSACLWRCRTRALQLDPDQMVRLLFTANGRSRLDPPLPAGYYGNGFAYPAALSTVRDLCGNPFEYAVELVKLAKANVTDEYMRSFTDSIVIRGQTPLSMERSYLVTDASRLGFGDLDFGWGKPVYGGPAKGEVGPIPGLGNNLLPFRNNKGENEVLAPVCLPAPAMERFVIEVESMLMDDQTSH